MSIKTITSVANPLVKQVVSLHDKKGRAAHGQCIVEGKRAILTCLAGKMKPVLLFVTQRAQAAVSELSSVVEVIEVYDSVMRKISPSSTPSGLLAVFEIPQQPEFSELSAGLVLVQLQDPGNVGTLIRTSAALQRRSIVCVEGVDPWSPKVIQASAGTIGMMSVFEMSWEILLAQKKQLRLCALVVHGGRQPSDIDIHNSLLIVGSEGHGLPEKSVAACEDLMTLPMPGGTESLNAAVAGSIALYLAYRQGN